MACFKFHPLKRVYIVFVNKLGGTNWMRLMANNCVFNACLLFITNEEFPFWASRGFIKLGLSQAAQLIASLYGKSEGLHLLKRPGACTIKLYGYVITTIYQ